MIVKGICLNCGECVEGELLNDELGTHMLCSKCNSSFDISVESDDFDNGRKDIEMTIYKAIENAKQKLISKASEEGIYENFGQAEVRNIREKYDPMLNDQISIAERNAQINAISSFNEWCSCYTG